MNYILMAALMSMDMVLIVQVLVGMFLSIMLVGMFVFIFCVATHPDSPPSSSLPRGDYGKGPVKDPCH